MNTETLNRLPGVNVLLMGPAGTGKTHAIGTLVEADPSIDVFYLALESGMESLMGYFTDKKKEVPANLHWHKVKPQKADFTELLKSAEKVNTMSLEVLSKAVDPDKSKYDQFRIILTALNNFVDQRTGEEFGAVNSWGADRILVIDGLTGLCDAAMSLVIGGKPVRNQNEWGIAQGQVLTLIKMLCDNCDCHFVLLGHVSRETDQVLGGVKLIVSALGQALGPVLPTKFSDVILASRIGDKFTWDTASATADVKTRNLPIKAGQVPDFKNILDVWKSRNS